MNVYFQSSEYDLVNRLEDLERGSLNGAKNGITDKEFAECWSLDQTGNWKNYREDADGDGTWNLNQNRTANKVNEIANITESAGPSWVTPGYNKAGNMTTIPQPADPMTSFTATYDAWNRLVKIVDNSTSNTISEYEYDGAKRRSVQKAYVSGSLDETRHFYYTEPSKWQVVEERVDASSTAERQFLWGKQYVDDLLLRDRDTTGNGTLDERLYGLQDANWNVTSIADTGGAIQERYVYSAYGAPASLNASFGSRSSSNYDWELLYAGYRWDSVAELFHIRNRVLSTALGIWIQRDPIGYMSNLNLYQYVYGQPTIYVDPHGTVAFIVVVVVVVGVFVITTIGGHDDSSIDPARHGLTFEECACNNLSGLNVLFQLWLENVRNRGAGTDENGADAFRHCLTSCQSAKLCGLLLSQEYRLIMT